MFGQNNPQPVDVLVVEDTRIDGQHVAAGTVLKQCPPDLAMELAAGGKVRPATEDLVREFKARKKAADAQAEATAQAKAEREAGVNAATASMIASGVAAALQALGIAPKPAA